ncbi:MAG: hypothetical protein AAF653_12030 [Chloroflexota bacterium]
MNNENQFLTDAQRVQLYLDQIRALKVDKLSGATSINAALAELDAIKQRVNETDNRQVLFEQLTDEQRFDDYTMYSIRHVPGYGEALHALGKTEEIQILGGQNYYVAKVKTPYVMLSDLIAQIKDMLDRIRGGETNVHAPQIADYIFGDELNGWQFGDQSELVSFAREKVALVYAQAVTSFENTKKYVRNSSPAGCVKSVGTTLGPVFVIGGILMGIVFQNYPNPWGVVALFILTGVGLTLIGQFSEQVANYVSRKERRLQTIEKSLIQLSADLKAVEDMEDIRSLQAEIEQVRAEISELYQIQRDTPFYLRR